MSFDESARSPSQPAPAIRSRHCERALAASEHNPVELQFSALDAMVKTTGQPDIDGPRVCQQPTEPVQPRL